MGKGSGDGGGGGGGGSMFDFSSLKTDAPKPTFMDHLGDYLKQRYPIAGGIAGAVMPGQGAPAGYTPPNDAPAINLPQQPLPDYSGLIQQNAQPKSDGGLMKLLLSMM